MADPGKIILKSTTTDGTLFDVQSKSGFLHLKGLEFDPAKTYILEFDAEFSSASTVLLFFSDSTRRSGPRYSNDKTLLSKTDAGAETLYFDLSYDNLGSSMRIHPSRNAGEVTVRSIRIKEFDRDP